ncbi:hypothetical protein BDC45DRAFT_538961 [Circinella umbellata]|nr:hypothetical protein BDC45DRAFT_538961 [Circinella umbellata]
MPPKYHGFSDRRKDTFKVCLQLEYGEALMSGLSFQPLTKMVTMQSNPPLFALSHQNEKTCIRHSQIQHCKKCKNHSLPVVLIHRQLFPLTPKNPNVAIHVEQIRSMHLMQNIYCTSIYAISEWAKAEYHYQLPIPASFKRRLSKALPMYACMMLNLEKEHKELSNLESGCPACSRRLLLMKTSSSLSIPGKMNEPEILIIKDKRKIIFDIFKADEGCRNFQALNKKGGSKRHLDQTCVFACTCGHGYPLVAMNMTTPSETFTYIQSNGNLSLIVTALSLL